MSTEALFNLFLLVSAIHGFVFSIILFYSKNGREKSMRYLNLMILAISLNNIQSWVLTKDLFQHKFMLDYIQIPWHFLVAPFFYVFLVHYLKIQEKTPKLLKIVFPIFLLAIIAQVFFVTIYCKDSHPANLDLLYEKYTSTEELLSFIVSISIFIYAFFIVNKREDLFSKILTFDNLKWIYTFFKLGALSYIFWIAALIVKINLNFSGFLFSYYPLRIATTLLIYWIGYQAFIQIKLLKERKQIREQLLSEKQLQTDTVTTQPTATLSQRESPKSEAQFLEIDNYIRSHKKYLEPKYTLEHLAKDLNLSSSTLSAVINANAQQSFTEYMNIFRVKQAKELLTHPDYANYTITAIGLESGFNSKSSFYAVFKKQVNCTPAAYKDTHGQ